MEISARIQFCPDNSAQGGYKNVIFVRHTMLLDLDGHKKYIYIYIYMKNDRWILKFFVKVGKD